MGDRATRLKEALGALSFEDRAALAHFLIDSLANEPDDASGADADERRRIAIAARLPSDDQLAAIATETEPME